MTCPACGFKNPSHSKFCQSCGQKLAQQSSASATDRRIRIGREADNDLVIADHQQVSRHHAMVVRKPNGQFIIEDLGTRNGIKVNGRRIEGPTTFVLTDEIKLGSYILNTAELAYDNVSNESLAAPIMVGSNNAKLSSVGRGREGAARPENENADVPSEPRQSEPASSGDNPPRQNLSGVACPFCGAPLPSGVLGRDIKFCSNCSSQLFHTGQPHRSDKLDAGSVIWMCGLMVVLALGYLVFPWLAGNAIIEVQPKKLPVTFGLTVFTLFLVGCHLITGALNQKFSRSASGLTFLLTLLVFMGPLLDILVAAQKIKSLPDGAISRLFEEFTKVYLKKVEFGGWLTLGASFVAWISPHTGQD
jgi:pSer/pThr/pTyr-binding forkhead associated (FHA) protein